MNTYHVGRPLALALITATGIGFSAVPAQAELNEIVVTAQRRSENIQSVPVAVNAFTSVELEQRQIHSGIDLVTNTPNLIGENNVGQFGAAAYFMRGVGSDDSLVAFEPPVATYIDDALLPRQISNNVAFLDLERVEVLRGPQGTLYGRNTTGGAIKIVTKKPDDQFSAKINTRLGNFDQVDAMGTINVPLSNNLFVKGSYFYQADDGYVRNTATGQRANDRNVQGGRFALRLLPTQEVTLDVSVDYSKRDGAGFLPATSLTSLRRVFSPAQATPGYGDRVKEHGVIANLKWDPGAFTLESITSYRKVKQDLLFDLNLLAIPGLFLIDQDTEAKVFTQEVKVNGTTSLFGRNLDYVGGIYYLNEDNTQSANDILLGTPSVTRDFAFDITSWAGYAQFDWEVIPNVTVVAGGRYTFEKKVAQIFTTDVFAGTSFTIADVIAGGVPDTLKEYQMNPKAGIEWQVNEDMLLYFMAVNSFKSGGWNSRVASVAEFVNFAPETVWSYEVGAKTEWLDNRLRVNLTGFWANYSDSQITVQIGTTPTGPIFGLGNGGDIRVRGIELEISANPFEGLNTFLNVGFMDAEYRRISPLAPSTITLSTPIKRVPDWNLQAGGTYRRPVGNVGDVFLSADVSWTGDYTITSDPAARIAAGGIPARPDLTLINAQVGFESENGAYRIQAECTNCGDRDYFNNELAGGIYQGDPLRWGIRVILKYN